MKELIPYEDDDYEEDDRYIRVYEAAEIWIANGMNKRYAFGYTEEELRAVKE